MDPENFSPKLKAYFKNSRSIFSAWLEITMNHARASYSFVASSMGITRDGLYKKANSELPNNNLLGAEIPAIIAATDDYTILQELADLFDFELVPRGTMAKIKALPDALPAPDPEDSYPLYRKQPRRPLLRAVLEEAAEK